MNSSLKTEMYKELKLSSSVSYVGNKKIPFLRIYRYKEAFVFSFVKDFLKRFNVSPDDYVFDQFSGLWTTMFTSISYSVPSIGIDKLSVAYFISKTLPLFLFLKENEIKEIRKSVKPRIEKSKPADIAMDVPIMQVAFSDENFLLLRKLKTAIDKLSELYRDIFLLQFFSILEECSFTSKDGQFLRLKRNKKVSNPIEAMNKKVKKVAQVEEDIRRMKFLYSDLTIWESYSWGLSCEYAGSV